MELLNNWATLLLLFAGAIFSIFLAVRPTILLWFITLFTLVIVGITGYFFPNLKIMGWISYGAASLLYVPAVLNLVRNKSDKRFPFLSRAAVILVWLFVVVCLVSSAASVTPVPQLVVASKSLFMFGGLWAFLAVYPASEKLIASWLKMLLFIGLVQPLPVLYQFLFVRSWRVAHTQYKVESADSVVGTFGGSQISGGLGAVLALYLVIAILFVLAIKRYKLIKNMKMFIACALLAFPIPFMEVKVVVFYFPLGLLVLYKDYLYRRPVKFLAGVIVSALVLFGMLVSLQALHWSLKGGTIEENMEKAFRYSFEVESRDGFHRDIKMSRLGVLVFWAEQHGTRRFINTIIGHGLGASRTQGQVMGVEAIRYGKKIDQTGLSTMLWDVGLLGVFLLLAILAVMFLLAGKLSKVPELKDWQKALAGGLQSTIPLLFLSFSYRHDIPYAAPMMFLTMAIFGLIFWLNRQAAMALNR